MVFSHAYVRPVWLKCAVIALPFLAVASDISSWYLVKLFHPFALVVIGGGMLMAACFAFMWFVTMYQLWFSRPPRNVLDRSGGDSKPLTAPASLTRYRSRAPGFSLRRSAMPAAWPAKPQETGARLYLLSYLSALSAA